MLGYYEETHYAKGHFQSVVPIRDSPVLNTILTNGGFDVASFHAFPENGKSNTYQSLYLINIKF